MVKLRKELLYDFEITFYNQQLNKINLKKITPIHLLIAVNILTIVYALWQHWDFGNILWVYWGQNVSYWFG